MEVRPAVVFDLDETLISSGIVRMFGDENWVRVGRRRVYIRTRPGLEKALKALSKHFDIYFFTAGLREYGNAVIDLISPETPEDRRFFRDDCMSYCGYMVKDLSLTGLPLERVLLIDDLDVSAALQPKNLVRMSAWNGELTDKVLEDELVPALEAIAGETDLRCAYREYLEKVKSQDLTVCCLEE